MTNLPELLQHLRQVATNGEAPGEYVLDALDSLIGELATLGYDAENRNTRQSDFAELCARWGIEPSKWKDPPPEAWVEIDGHRWATDGAILFREDSPRPLSHRDGEPYRIVSADVVRRMVATAKEPGQWPAARVFHRRFVRVLRELTAMPCSDPVVGVCWRDGEIVAVVARMSEGRGVGPDGSPVVVRT